MYAKDRQSSASASPSSTPSSSANTSSQTSSSVSSSSSQSGNYKDGTYKGDAAETPYGTVQIAVVINGGKITDVNFLQMPNDFGHTQEVTAMSEPLLKHSTLSSQNSNVDFISGATSTCYGYQESLQAALDQAKLS